MAKKAFLEGVEDMSARGQVSLKVQPFRLGVGGVRV